MNITTFITWFINQFVRIATNLIGQLDNITIGNNVSLLDFTITITIIGILISIILTLPTNINRYTSRYERNKNKERKTK